MRSACDYGRRPRVTSGQRRLVTAIGPRRPADVCAVQRGGGQWSGAGSNCRPSAFQLCRNRASRGEHQRECHPAGGPVAQRRGQLRGVGPVRRGAGMDRPRAAIRREVRRRPGHRQCPQRVCLQHRGMRRCAEHHSGDHATRIVPDPGRPLRRCTGSYGPMSGGRSVVLGSPSIQRRRAKDHPAAAPLLQRDCEQLAGMRSRPPQPRSTTTPRTSSAVVTSPTPSSCRRRSAQPARTRRAPAALPLRSQQPDDPKPPARRPPVRRRGLRRDPQPRDPRARRVGPASGARVPGRPERTGPVDRRLEAR
jgi:hypothetical protein